MLLLKGSAASPGVVEGTARVVLSLDKTAKFRRKDILVTVVTSPTWTPLIHASAAVVTDAGGVLSHAAIVSREYGIPAVVGTKVATTTIKDGQKIRVNGTKGTVELI